MFSLGTKIVTSAKFDIFPPVLPVNKIVFKPLNFACFIAAIILAELPLVEIPTKRSFSIPIPYKSTFLFFHDLDLKIEALGPHFGRF